MKKIIVTSTDCYHMNASHSGSTQRQIVLEIDGEKEPLVSFVNIPADSDRGQVVIFEMEITDDQLEAIEKLKYAYNRTMTGLNIPSLYGGADYDLKTALKSVLATEKQSKDLMAEFARLQVEVQNLQNKLYPFQKIAKQEYCTKVYELLNITFDDLDGRKTQFEYFQSLFW